MSEREAQPVRPVEFRVCRRAREPKWVVRLRNSLCSRNPTYGVYLDKEQAVLDAIDAARDALQDGKDAQVWIRDRSTSSPVF
jgi:hypothetical protein